LTVTETDTVQRVDESGGNHWRWIWCNTLCKTWQVGNGRLQTTEIINHSWWLKVWQSWLITSKDHSQQHRESIKKYTEQKVAELW